MTQTGCHNVMLWVVLKIEETERLSRDPGDKRIDKQVVTI